MLLEFIVINYGGRDLKVSVYEFTELIMTVKSFVKQAQAPVSLSAVDLLSSLEYSFR
jgi:hypothetical protein